MDENIIFALTRYGTATYGAITGDQNPLVMGYWLLERYWVDVKRFSYAGAVVGR